MRLLALSDSVTISLAIFELIFSAIVSITLWRLTAWQRRYEGLEGKLNDASTRLIDERFESMGHDAERNVQAFVVALDEIKQKMVFGDADVRALGERDQRIELTLAARIDLLKDYIRDNAATKKDLEKHEAGAERRLAVLETRFAQVASRVAALTERIKA